MVSLVSDCKDRVLEKMALPVLNNSILQPYGRAMNLRINSAAKNVALRGSAKAVVEATYVAIDISAPHRGRRRGSCGCPYGTAWGSG